MSLPFPRSRLVSALAVLLTCGHALAEPAPSAGAASAAPATSSNVVVEVKSTAHGLDSAAIDAAVRSELEKSRDPIAAGTRIVVKVDERRSARVEAHTEGEVRTRQVALPAAPKAALEVLSLVSASLVRSDADALAAALRAARAPANEPQPTAASEAASSEPPKGEPASGDAPTPGAGTETSTNASAVAAEPNEPAATAPAAEKPASPEKTTKAPAKLAHPKKTKPEFESTPINLSVFHPIAVLPDSHERDVHFELGLFYSYVGELHGFGTNGAALRTEEDMQGVSVAGLFSMAGGSGLGLNTAGLISHSGGGFDGLTTSGLLDVREGPLRGLQAGGLLASAHRTEGLQTGGLIAYGHDLTGLQVGGIFAHSGNLMGLQTGGVFASSDLMQGLQAGGVLANATTVQGFQTGGIAAFAEDTQGVGVAGLLNHTRDVRGARIAAVNLSRDVSGMQIGIVNVGRNVNGTQLGVVNVADKVERGFPVGVVNAVGNGRNQAVAWYDGRIPLNAGLKYMQPRSSGAGLSSIVACGVKPATAEQDVRLAPGFAFGARTPMFGPADKLFVELDAMARVTVPLGDDSHTEDPNGDDSSARLTLGVQVTRDIALFGGVGAGFAWRDGFDAGDLPIAGVQVF